jgi:hypothetical protein
MMLDTPGYLVNVVGTLMNPLNINVLDVKHLSMPCMKVILGSLMNVNGLLRTHVVVIPGKAGTLDMVGYLLGMMRLRMHKHRTWKEMI